MDTEKKILQFIASTAKTKKKGLSVEQKQELYAATDEYYPGMFETYPYFEKKLRYSRSTKKLDTTGVSVPFRLRCKSIIKSSDKVKDRQDGLPELPDFLGESEFAELEPMKSFDVSNNADSTFEEKWKESEDILQESTNESSGLGITEEWLNEFSKPMEIFENWNEKVDKLQSELSELDAARRKIKTDISSERILGGTPGMSFQDDSKEDVFPVEVEEIKEETRDVAIESDKLLSHDDLEESVAERYGDFEKEEMAEFESQFQKKISALNVKEHDVENMKNDFYTQKVSLLEREHELEQREEVLLFNERMVEKKQTLLAKNIISTRDPIVIEALDVIETRFKEALDMKNSLHSRERSIANREKSLQRKQERTDQTYQFLEATKAKAHEDLSVLDAEKQTLRQQINTLINEKEKVSMTIESKQQDLNTLLNKEESWLATKEKLLTEISTKSQELINKESVLDEELQNAKSIAQQYKKQEGMLEETYRKKYSDLETLWQKKNVEFDDMLRQKKQEISVEASKIRDSNTKLAKREEEIDKNCEALRSETIGFEDKQREFHAIEKRLADKMRDVDSQATYFASNKDRLEKAIEEVTARLEEQLKQKTHEFKKEKESLLNREKQLLNKITQLKQKEHYVGVKSKSLSDKDMRLRNKENILERQYQNITRKEKTLDTKKSQITSQLDELKTIERELEKKIEGLAMDRIPRPKASKFKLTENAINVPDVSESLDNMEEDIPLPPATVAPKPQLVSSSRKTSSTKSLNIKRRIELLLQLANNVVDVDYYKARDIYKITKELFKEISPNDRKDIHKSIYELYNRLQKKAQSGVVS
jgi:hypothetical protein